MAIIEKKTSLIRSLSNYW